MSFLVNALRYHPWDTQKYPWETSMVESKKPLSVALAFAAALLTAPALSSAASHDASPAAAAASAVLDQLQPSAAALQRLETVLSQQASMRPRFIDLWPEVTHVESVRQP
jgi:hypothetical protein